MRLVLIAFLAAAACTSPTGTESEAHDAGPGGDARDRKDDVGLAADASVSDASAAVDAGSADAGESDAALPDHLLSVTTTIGGFVTVTVESVVIGTCPANQSCDFLIGEGSFVILSTTNETLSFCSWSGACSGGGGGLCALMMDAPKATTAQFQSSDQDCP